LRKVQSQARDNKRCRSHNEKWP